MATAKHNETTKVFFETGDDTANVLKILCALKDRWDHLPTDDLLAVAWAFYRKWGYPDEGDCHRFTSFDFDEVYSQIQSRSKS